MTGPKPEPGGLGNWLNGNMPATRTDATAVGMPDPRILEINAKLKDLHHTYTQAQQALIQEMDAVGGGMAGKGKLSPLDVLGMATGGDHNATTMMRTGVKDIPAAQRDSAAAAVPQSKFSK